MRWTGAADGGDRAAGRRVRRHAGDRRSETVPATDARTAELVRVPRRTGRPGRRMGRGTERVTEHELTEAGAGSPVTAEQAAAESRCGTDSDAGRTPRPADFGGRRIPRPSDDRAGRRRTSRSRRGRGPSRRAGAPTFEELRRRPAVPPWAAVGLPRSCIVEPASDLRRPRASWPSGGCAYGRSRRPERAAGDPEPFEPAALAAEELRGALEAILLVVDEPVGEHVLAQVLEQPAERIAATLARARRGVHRSRATASSCAGRPAAGGLYTRAEYAPTWSGSCWTGSRSG